MAKKVEAAHVDDRLARLLETEQRLEVRVRDAETAARVRVLAARAAATGADGRRLAELEAAAASQERIDLEDHVQQLHRIAVESEEQLRALSSVPEAVIDRLARSVLARIIDEGSET